MIDKFVSAFMEHKAELQAKFEIDHPEDYLAIVKQVITILQSSDWYESPDPKHIHEINDGDWQGTLVYVIPEKTYQPSTYWYVRINYGSCSGCDTLQSIQVKADGKPTLQQVEDYMTLALHIVQGLKLMDEDTI